jgi:organic hydroperoxide reductase OsmC/OhrA
MSEYTATTLWTRDGQAFTDNRYSRRHAWQFDGGAEVAASASPLHVRAPMSDPSAVDPEEAFVAAISSCHMLFFLSIAARQGFRVDRYLDQAVGIMAKDDEGKLAMTEVTLRPDVTFSGDLMPSRSEIDQMHHESHESCYIASSVKSLVLCEPVYPAAESRD